MVDEEHVLQLCYIQTSHMITLFEKFPEIVFIDGTYNVNCHGMPLYCIMIEDGYGHGRVVFYAATVEGDTLHLRKMMQCFKENNPKFSSIRVVIIDKDFAEWKMLKEELPNAVVLFCQWHVLRAMFKQLSDCGVEKLRRDDARGAIQCLVHAKTQDDYYVKKQELFDTTNDRFKEYFLSNWEACIEMWATFKRDEYVHYGNTTNNRLESHNQKLKDVTSRTSTLSEMFEKVVFL